MLNFCDRLKEERKRLGYNQAAFGALANVSKTTQFNYEKGDRQPDSDYLAAIAELKVDVMYVLTGSRSLNFQLSSEENALLDNYRHLDAKDQEAVYKVSEAMNATYGVKKDTAE